MGQDLSLCSAIPSVLDAGRLLGRDYQSDSQGLVDDSTILRALLGGSLVDLPVQASSVRLHQGFEESDDGGLALGVGGGPGGGTGGGGCFPYEVCDPVVTTSTVLLNTQVYMDFPSGTCPLGGGEGYTLYRDLTITTYEDTVVTTTRIKQKKANGGACPTIVSTDTRVNQRAVVTFHDVTGCGGFGCALVGSATSVVVTQLDPIKTLVETGPYQCPDGSYSTNRKYRVQERVREQTVLYYYYAPFGGSTQPCPPTSFPGSFVDSDGPSYFIYENDCGPQ